MGQDKLHIKLNIVQYQIPPVRHKFAHIINEIQHRTCKIAHIADGFGHAAPFSDATLMNIDK